MPDQINPTIGKAEDLFKSLVWDNSVDVALTALHVNVWPINTFIKIFTDKIYECLRLVVDFKIIAFRNQQASEVYTKAVVDLKILRESKGTDSEEYRNALKQAKDDYDRANRINT